jgi:AcrR family transcriptional regulator
MPKRLARRDQPEANPNPTDGRNLRTALLDTTEQLLVHQRFNELSVADILIATGVSRASFYFYFDSKYAVLEALVRRVVEGARALAQPWIEKDTEMPEQTLHQGTELAVQLWIQHGPVLRAIVENWRSDERLTKLWTELMEGFTKAAIYRIERDQKNGRAPVTEVDVQTLASTLTWMNERIFYLTAIRHQGFTNPKRVTEVLTHTWLTAIYGAKAT